MSFFSRPLLSFKRSTSSTASEKSCEVCNYGDNYYGDQVCVPPGAQTSGPVQRLRP